MQMRRQGMMCYGPSPRAMGEQFEKRWLDRAASLDEGGSDRPRFLHHNRSLSTSRQITHQSGPHRQNYL